MILARSLFSRLSLVRCKAQKYFLQILLSLLLLKASKIRKPECLKLADDRQVDLKKVYLFPDESNEERHLRTSLYALPTEETAASNLSTTISIGICYFKRDPDRQKY